MNRGLVQHDARTLFEKAWAHGVATGLIDAEVSARVTKDGAKGIRKIASVLGSDHLRPDLERAMRSMLALINLNLEFESGADVDQAARSIAKNGILYHTRGASQRLKLCGFDEQSIVVQHAFAGFARFCQQINEREQRLNGLAAARWALKAIGYPGDIVPEEADAAICTAMLFMIYQPGKQWADDMPGFESMLEAVRKHPGKAQQKLPAIIPAEHLAAISSAWLRGSKKILDAIKEKSVTIHNLASASVEGGVLTGLLLAPGGALMSEINNVADIVTTHWTRLTKGRSDDEALLALMLTGLLCSSVKTHLTSADAKAIAIRIHEPPTDDQLDVWLDANAPHGLQSGLKELWRDFWVEANHIHPDSESRRLAYIKKWVAVGRPSKRK